MAFKEQKTPRTRPKHFEAQWPALKEVVGQPLSRGIPEILVANLDENAGAVFASQYVEGATRFEDANIPLEDVARRGQALAVALRDLHSHGLVHGEVSPKSCMIVAADTWLVSFGFFHADSDKTLLLPPQSRPSAELNSSHDVYALALTLAKSVSPSVSVLDFDAETWVESQDVRLADVLYQFLRLEERESSLDALLDELTWVDRVRSAGVVAPPEPGESIVLSPPLDLNQLDRLREVLREEVVGLMRAALAQPPRDDAAGGIIEEAAGVLGVELGGELLSEEERERVQVELERLLSADMQGDTPTPDESVVEWEAANFARLVAATISEAAVRLARRSPAISSRRLDERLLPEGANSVDLIALRSAVAQSPLSEDHLLQLAVGLQSRLLTRREQLPLYGGLYLHATNDGLYVTQADS